MISTLQSFHPHGHPKDRAATALFGAFAALATGAFVVPSLAGWASSILPWFGMLILFCGLAATVAAAVGWMFFVKGFERREGDIQQLAYAAYLQALSDEALLSAYQSADVDGASRHLVGRELSSRGLVPMRPGGIQ